MRGHVSQKLECQTSCRHERYLSHHIHRCTLHVFPKWPHLILARDEFRILILDRLLKPYVHGSLLLRSVFGSWRYLIRLFQLIGIPQVFLLLAQEVRSRKRVPLLLLNGCFLWIRSFLSMLRILLDNVQVHVNSQYPFLRNVIVQCNERCVLVQQKSHIHFQKVIFWNTLRKWLFSHKRLFPNTFSSC